MKMNYHVDDKGLMGRADGVNGRWSSIRCDALDRLPLAKDPERRAALLLKEAIGLLTDTRGARTGL